MAMYLALPQIPRGLLKVAVALSLVVAVAPAWSCARTFTGEYGLELSYQEVFLARIVAKESTPTNDAQADVIVADYVLLEKFRGSPPAHGKVTEMHWRGSTTSCDSYVLKAANPGDEVLLYVTMNVEKGERFPGVDSTPLLHDANRDHYLTRLRQFRAEQIQNPKAD